MKKVKPEEETKQAWDEMHKMEAGRLEGKQGGMSGKSNKTNLETVLASLGQKSGVAELNEEVQKLSRWSTFRNKRMQAEWVLELKRTISVFEQYQGKVVDADTPMKKVARLSELEQVFSASGVLGTAIIAMFGEVLDVYFEGDLPSQAALLKFRKDVEHLAGTTFGTKGMKVTEWAWAQINPKNCAYPEEIAEEKDDFIRHLRKEFTEIANHLMASSVTIHRPVSALTEDPASADYTSGYIGAFFNGFYEALDRGEYMFMASDMFGRPQLRSVYDKTKQVLGWTQMGSVVEQLWQRSILSVAVNTPISAIDFYKRIGTVVMPKFIQEMTMLLATLESQVKAVEFLQSKVLAASVSLFITGAPVAVKLVYRATGFNTDEDPS